MATPALQVCCTPSPLCTFSYILLQLLHQIGLTLECPICFCLMDVPYSYVFSLITYCFVLTFSTGQHVAIHAVLAASLLASLEPSGNTVGDMPRLGWREVTRGPTISAQHAVLPYIALRRFQSIWRYWYYVYA